MGLAFPQLCQNCIAFSDIEGHADGGTPSVRQTSHAHGTEIPGQLAAIPGADHIFAFRLAFGEVKQRVNFGLDHSVLLPVSLPGPGLECGYV